LKSWSFLDRPLTGSVCRQGGRVEAAGWGFFPGTAAHLVEIRLDGRLWHVQACNRQRPDVARAYPQALTLKTPVGFVFSLDWPEDARPGQHRVEVFLIHPRGKKARLGAVEITLAPGAGFSDAGSEAPPVAGHAVADAAEAVFLAAKARKLERLRPWLRPGVPFKETPAHYDFLNPALREKYSIIDTAQVSSHGYDALAEALLAKHAQGLILDCGAGSRPVYYEHVVNFEIAPYATTDVLGVGEELPFADNTFDAVLSLNVLEHVRDPFQCAREIARVMKPGADLYCVAAFLQPLHGYPHHYYNMSQTGLRNLFEKHLDIDRQEVIASGLPIWSMNWMLGQWAAALPEPARGSFLGLRVSDLVKSPVELLEQDFVSRLPEETNRALATSTALFAVKNEAQVQAEAEGAGQGAPPASPLFCLDLPRPGQAHLRAFPLEFSGWGFFPDGPAKFLEISANGVFLAVQPLGTPRPDVAAAHPQAAPFQDKLGFAGLLAWPDNLPDGTHSLQFYLGDSRGQRIRVAEVSLVIRTQAGSSTFEERFASLPLSLALKVNGSAEASLFQRIGDLTADIITAHAGFLAGREAPAMLDFGCGLGRVMAPLQARFPRARFTGFDIDPDMLRWLRLLYPGQTADLISSTCAVPDNAFDFIYAISVFTHLDRQTGYWLGEIARLLAPGGRALLTFHDDSLFAEKYPAAERFPESFVHGPETPEGGAGMGTFYTPACWERKLRGFFHIETTQVRGLFGDQSFSVVSKLPGSTPSAEELHSYLRDLELEVARRRLGLSGA
jgi:ubiquinone/menaquinone biosynthesis C-methylase UbiE